jgi:hypothetical protein
MRSIFGNNKSSSLPANQSFLLELNTLTMSGASFVDIDKATKEIAELAKNQSPTITRVLIFQCQGLNAELLDFILQKINGLTEIIIEDSDIEMISGDPRSSDPRKDRKSRNIECLLNCRNLKRLQLKNCPKLKVIRLYGPRLRDLEIADLPALVDCKIIAPISVKNLSEVNNYAGKNLLRLSGIVDPKRVNKIVNSKMYRADGSVTASPNPIPIFAELFNSNKIIEDVQIVNFGFKNDEIEFIFQVLTSNSIINKITLSVDKIDVLKIGLIIEFLAQNNTITNLVILSVGNVQSPEFIDEKIPLLIEALRRNPNIIAIHFLTKIESLPLLEQVPMRIGQFDFNFQFLATNYVPPVSRENMEALAKVIAENQDFQRQIKQYFVDGNIASVKEMMTNRGAKKISRYHAEEILSAILAGDWLKNKASESKINEVIDYLEALNQTKPQKEIDSDLAKIGQEASSSITEIQSIIDYLFEVSDNIKLTEKIDSALDGIENKKLSNFLRVYLDRKISILQKAREFEMSQKPKLEIFEQYLTDPKLLAPISDKQELILKLQDVLALLQRMPEIKEYLELRENIILCRSHLLRVQAFLSSKENKAKYKSGILSNLSWMLFSLEDFQNQLLQEPLSELVAKAGLYYYIFYSGYQAIHVNYVAGIIETNSAKISSQSEGDISDSSSMKTPSRQSEQESTDFDMLQVAEEVSNFIEKEESDSEDEKDQSVDLPNANSKKEKAKISSKAVTFDLAKPTMITISSVVGYLDKKRKKQLKNELKKMLAKAATRNYYIINVVIDKCNDPDGSILIIVARVFSNVREIEIRNSTINKIANKDGQNLCLLKLETLNITNSGIYFIRMSAPNLTELNIDQSSSSLVKFADINSQLGFRSLQEKIPAAFFSSDIVTEIEYFFRKLSGLIFSVSSDESLSYKTYPAKVEELDKSLSSEVSEDYQIMRANLANIFANFKLIEAFFLRRSTSSRISKSINLEEQIFAIFKFCNELLENLNQNLNQPLRAIQEELENKPNLRSEMFKQKSNLESYIKGNESLKLTKSQELVISLLKALIQIPLYLRNSKEGELSQKDKLKLWQIFEIIDEKISEYDCLISDQEGNLGLENLKEGLKDFKKYLFDNNQFRNFFDLSQEITSEDFDKAVSNIMRAVVNLIIQIREGQDNEGNITEEVGLMVEIIQPRINAVTTRIAEISEQNLHDLISRNPKPGLQLTNPLVRSSLAGYNLAIKNFEQAHNISRSLFDSNNQIPDGSGLRTMSLPASEPPSTKVQRPKLPPRAGVKK